MNISHEEIIIWIMFFVGWPWVGYYAYLAWRKPASFIAMAEKSLWLYGNSSAMREWFHSRSYLLLAKVSTLFAFLLLSFVNLGMLWTLLRYLWRSLAS